MIKYGTDPEMFLVEKFPWDKYDHFLDTKQRLVPPAYLLMTGELEQVIPDVKHPILFTNEIGNIIMDGAALEFNLKRPYENPVEMYFDVQAMIKEARKLAKSVKRSLYLKPVANYDYYYFNNPEWLSKDQYFQGVIFGCDPDENCWETDWRCSVLDASKHPFRYAGAHLHFSGEEVLENALQAARMLSIFVGNYVVVHSMFPELDRKRAEYYGMAGKFRPQKYKDGSVGIEYRSPSVSWLSYDIGTFEGMIHAANEAIRCLKHWDSVGKDVVERFGKLTIKNMADINIEGSKEILSKLGL